MVRPKRAARARVVSYSEQSPSMHARQEKRSYPFESTDKAETKKVVKTEPKVLKEITNVKDSKDDTDSKGRAEENRSQNPRIPDFGTECTVDAQELAELRVYRDRFLALKQLRFSDAETALKEYRAAVKEKLTAGDKLIQQLRLELKDKDSQQESAHESTRLVELNAELQKEIERLNQDLQTIKEQNQKLDIESKIREESAQAVDVKVSEVTKEMVGVKEKCEEIERVLNALQWLTGMRVRNVEENGKDMEVELKNNLDERHAVVQLRVDQELNEIEYTPTIFTFNSEKHKIPDYLLEQIDFEASERTTFFSKIVDAIYSRLEAAENAEHIN